MKTSILVVALLLGFGNATAQDLQFRTVIRTDIPGMNTADMPRPEMTMFLKGSKMRVDTEMSFGKADPPDLPELLSMSIITDRSTGKMIMLNHGEKEYSEQDFTQPELKMDSAQQAAMSRMQPAIRETSDTATINGFKTRRFVVSMELPFNPMPGAEAGRFLLVMEQWGASDSVLVEAHRIMQAMVPMAGLNANPAMFADLAKTGFPVRSTMVMVNLAVGATADVEKILKAGAGAEGLQMRMQTEMKDIKTGPLDGALFEVPKDYTKR